MAAIALPSTSHAQENHGARQFYPGNLVVSRSVYDSRTANVTVGETLPPDCVTSTGTC